MRSGDRGHQVRHTGARGGGEEDCADGIDGPDGDGLVDCDDDDCGANVCPARRLVRRAR